MDARQLAAAIRKGHTMIGETSTSFFTRDGSCGCALGAAWVGIGKAASEFSEERKTTNYFPAAFVSAFDMPYEILQQISCKHFGGMPRLEIATWLETLDKPKDAQSYQDFMKAALLPVLTEMEASK